MAKFYKSNCTGVNGNFQRNIYFVDYPLVLVLVSAADCQVCPPSCCYLLDLHQIEPFVWNQTVKVYNIRSDRYMKT